MVSRILREIVWGTLLGAAPPARPNGASCGRPTGDTIARATAGVRPVDLGWGEGYDWGGQMVSFEVRTHARSELVDVTAEVRKAVAATGVESGICFVFVPHTTATATVNEAFDPDVAADVTAALTRLVPPAAGYAHAEGNADAHIKAALVGACPPIPVASGELALGRWQGVFFCEFDGPRTRRCQVTVLADNHKS